MKSVIQLTLFLFFVAAIPTAAQSIEIWGEKRNYERPTPTSDYKKSFTINHVRVKSTSPAVSARIESLLSYEKAFDFTIEEQKADVQWLDEADFEINHNANGLLSIELYISGSSAYPDTAIKRLNIDTIRGVRLFPKDVFRNLPTLAARVKRMQTAEIAAAKRELRKNADAQDVDPNELFSRANFGVAELNAFQVTPRGVTFYYNYGFPHVLKALQPSGEYALTWRDIRPFLKPGSPLAKAAK